MARSVFLQSLDKIQPDKPELRHLYAPDVDDVQGLFAESLLFADSIILNLTGPEKQIAILLEWLGSKLTQELLDESVIQYAFVPSVGATYITQGQRVSRGFERPGLHFITLGKKRLNEPFHAISEGLKRHTSLDRGYRRHLARKFEKQTKVYEPLAVYQKAFEASKEDIRGSLGEEFGFAEYENPDDGLLPDLLVHRYLSIVHANGTLHVTSLVGSTESYADNITARVLSHRMSEILRPIGKHAADYRAILEAEQVSDLGALLRRGDLSFEEIIRLRRSRNGEGFRKWLGTVETAENGDAIREYFSELVNPLSQRKVVKTIKAVSYSAIGLAVATADVLIGGAVGVGLNVLDAFLLDKIIDRKWHPKAFVDDLRMATKESAD